MSILKFHKSTAKELLVIKNRVRDLIKHWGEDGRYKEAVLKSVIKRFLPEQFNIGTGFVIKEEVERGSHQSSKQIDLIIYNTAYPILFKESDFVILTPDAVNGIIEVKSNLSNHNFTNVIKQANKNGKFVFKNKVNYPFFNGIFSFDGYNNSFNPEPLKESILNSLENYQDDKFHQDYLVNNISFNNNYFYKFWKNDKTYKHKIYKIKELSFAFFISNLIDCVSVNSVLDNPQLWFPVDKRFNEIFRF